MASAVLRVGKRMWPCLPNSTNVGRYLTSYSAETSSLLGASIRAIVRPSFLSCAISAARSTSAFSDLQFPHHGA